ncbi:MAG: hypothetical protein AB1458_05965 [Bacteroidota bacterium]
MAVVNTIPNLCGTGLAAGGFFALAVIFLTIYLTNNILGCVKCACNPFPKWLGIIMLGMGICMFMFFGSNCAPISIAIPIFLVIAGFGMLYGWYLTYRDVCPLTICHFWDAVILTAIVSVIAMYLIRAAVLAVAIIPPNTIPNLSFNIGLVVAVIILLIAGVLRQININNNNCVNYP